MVRIGLQVRANLENVTGLRADGDDFRWYLMLRCANCGNQPDHFQYACAAESHPVKGGRGHASLVVKCRLCGRENSLDIEEGSVGELNAESGGFQTLVVFDCRGLEPTDFSPRVGWRCRSTESQTEFTDVDLTEKEWVEYDEKAAISVGIYELESQFVKIKH